MINATISCAIQTSSKKLVLRRWLVSVPKRLTTISYDGKWSMPTFLYSPPMKLIDEGEIRSPLLLIQGWGGAGDDWGNFPRMLANRCKRHVITYDARYIGNSYRIDKPNSAAGNKFEENLTMEDMVSDAMAVIDSALSHLADTLPGSESTTFSNGQQCRLFGKVSVAGVSMGGMIASEMAARIFHFVPLPITANKFSYFDLESLILLSSSPYLSDVTSEDQQVFLTAFDQWTDEDEAGYNYSCAEKFFEPIGTRFLALPGRKKIVQKLIHQFLESRRNFVQGNYGARAQLRAIETFNAQYYLENIGSNIPSMVIHGESDRVFSSINARIMHKSLNSKGMSEILILQEGADHHCWISHTQDIVSAIDEFFNNIR